MKTKYGVEIPCGSDGRPLRDAPGRYDQSARAMGSPVTHRVAGDYLPVMKQEAIDLRELAKAADRPGMGDMLRQIAEGYEGACGAIERLREHPVEWYHEDTLADLSKDVFDAAFKASRVIGGVRMYPFVRIDGVLHMAIVLGDVGDEFFDHTHIIEGYECSDPMDV